jgi:hypothetical protein
MRHYNFEFLKEMRETEPNITGDGTAIAPVLIKEIKHNIRKGAKDLNQKWNNSIHLVKKAYDVAGQELPKITQKDAWIQYTHLIGFAVRELAKARGAKGPAADWRISQFKDRGDDNTVLPKEVLPLPLGTNFSARK